MSGGVTGHTPFDANRVPVLSAISNADGTTVLFLEADATTRGLLTYVTNPIQNQVYTGSVWTNQRTPTSFKTATITASGNTAIWTPTTGKKFRLMGYSINAPDDVQAGAAGDVDVTFNDAGVAIGLGFTFWSPDNTSTSNRHMDNSGVVQLGNGYLSSAANNVLNVNLSAAITQGKIRVTVWGCEE